MENPAEDFALDTKAILSEPGVSPDRPLIYTALSAPNKIRLLRIDPPTSDPSMVVSLEEVGLQDNIEYQCLSYTWDGPTYSDAGEYWTTNHQRILCNGMHTYIRQNLYEALDQLRNSDMLGPIWIDALCINQDDLWERNSQVGQMGEIYKGGKRVIVWLGKEDKYTTLALASLDRSNISMEEYNKDPTSGPREYLRCKYTDEEALSMLCFTGERRWFSRLWIVQETVLAQRMIFLCGASFVLMEKLWKVMMFMRHSPAADLHLMLVWGGVFSARNFFGVLQHRYEGTRGLIGWAVHAFREARSTDPRDKFFGLLAISDSHDRHIPMKSEAGYSQTTQEVYIRAAHFALCDISDLIALAYVGDHSLNDVENLPSWVPDLSVFHWPRCFEYEGSRFSAANQDPWTPDFDDNVLALRGSLLDSVTLTSETQEEILTGHGISLLLQTLLPSAPFYPHSNESPGRAISRLFIADNLPRLDRLRKMKIADNEYDIEGALEKLLFRIICFALYKAGQLTMLEAFLKDPQVIFRTLNGDAVASEHQELSTILSRGKFKCGYSMESIRSDAAFTDTRMHSAIDCLKDPFAELWDFSFKLRRYFRSSIGYLGLGLHSVRPGDGIYLIKGASVPYIFRPVSENPADGFKLIGEAYVHGIMYGEAFSNGPLQFERMEIH